MRRALGVTNSPAAAAEEGGFVVHSRFSRLLLPGVPPTVAPALRHFDGVASNSLLFPCNPPAVFGLGFPLDFDVDFDGVPPDRGDSRSNKPMTRPFFCGVGPTKVRGATGVKCAEGGS